MIDTTSAPAEPSTASVAAVIRVVTETLGIEERADTLNASTQLFGNLPELDSLAVLELVEAIQEEFDITVDDEEFGSELFETVGSLAAFVEAKQAEER